MVTTHILFKLVFVLIFLSFLEYAGNRWILHKMSLARLEYSFNVILPLWDWIFLRQYVRLVPLWR